MIPVLADFIGNAHPQAISSVADPAPFNNSPKLSC
jgi:hypothetical protein